MYGDTGFGNEPSLLEGYVDSQEKAAEEEARKQQEAGERRRLAGVDPNRDVDEDPIPGMDITNEQINTIGEALQILTEAGADIETTRQFINAGVPGSSNIAELIVRNPALAEFWKTRFPSSGMSAYKEAEVGFGFAERLAQHSLNPALADAVLTGNEEALGTMEESRAGQTAKRTPEGVIVVTDDNDPTVAPVVQYPNDPKGTLPGSPKWLEKTEKWDDKTAKKWRKRLSNLGYAVDPEGGYAGDLKTALAGAYKDYYANGERWQQAAPVAKEPKDRVRMRDVFDRDVAKRLATTGMRTAWGAEPSEGEVEVWSQHLLDLAKYLIRTKGYDPVQARESAGAQFDTALEATPLAEANRDWDEEQTDLRDALVASAQVADQMAAF